MNEKYDVPKRYCTIHGAQMPATFSRQEYSSRTGEVEYVWVRYKCPRWFCGKSDSHLIFVLEAQRPG